MSRVRYSCAPNDDAVVMVYLDVDDLRVAGTADVDDDAELGSDGPSSVASMA